jgi:hypothetical protein
VRSSRSAHRVLSRGKDYYYWRRNRGTPRSGVSIRLPHVSDPELWIEVQRLSDDVSTKPKAGTFSSLVADYQSSPEWDDLSSASKSDCGRYLDHIGGLWGNLSVFHLKPEYVLKLRDTKVETPTSANYLLCVLSSWISE